MKNKILVIIAMALMIICTGCTPTVEKDLYQSETSMFVLVENIRSEFSIVYHKETKVMYAVSTGAYNHGNFTLLVNADGSPMIYGG